MKKEISNKLNCRIHSAKPIWTRSEHGLKGEEILKDIPRDLVIHDTYFKKVYNDDIEIKTGKNEDPTATLKTFMKNTVTMNFAPSIAEEIRSIFEPIIKTQIQQAENINFLAENINTHIPAIKKLGES